MKKIILLREIILVTYLFFSRVHGMYTFDSKVSILRTSNDAVELYKAQTIAGEWVTVILSKKNNEIRAKIQSPSVNCCFGKEGPLSPANAWKFFVTLKCLAVNQMNAQCE